MYVCVYQEVLSMHVANITIYPTGPVCVGVILSRGRYVYRIVAWRYAQPLSKLRPVVLRSYSHGIVVSRLRPSVRTVLRR